MFFKFNQKKEGISKPPLPHSNILRSLILFAPNLPFLHCDSLWNYESLLLRSIHKKKPLFLQYAAMRWNKLIGSMSSILKESISCMSQSYNIFYVWILKVSWILWILPNHLVLYYRFLCTFYGFYGILSSMISWGSLSLSSLISYMGSMPSVVLWALKIPSGLLVIGYTFSFGLMCSIGLFVHCIHKAGRLILRIKIFWIIKILILQCK